MNLTNISTVPAQVGTLRFGRLGLSSDYTLNGYLDDVELYQYARAQDSTSTW